MKILCDWIDDLRQYNLSYEYFLQLEQQCQNYGVKFELCKPESIIIEDPLVLAYIGNRFDVKFIDIFPKLKWVHFGSVGTDRLSAIDAKSNNIIVTNTSGVFEDSVALHAVNLVLASRNSFELENGFMRHTFESMYQDCLLNQQVLVLGTGPIAMRSYINFDTLGFDVQMIGRTRNKKQINNAKFLLHEDLANHSFKKPFLINLLPLNESTFGLVDEKYLSRLGPLGGYLNLGRKETEVTDIILKNLRLGKISYAAWDVIRDMRQAAEIKSEFGSKVTLTPHIASFHKFHWEKSIALLLNNLKEFLDGKYEKMRNLQYV